MWSLAQHNWVFELTNCYKITSLLGFMGIPKLQSLTTLQSCVCVYLYNRKLWTRLEVWYEPGVSTLAGEFTSSLPKTIPEETSPAYLSFFPNSGPVPRPIMSTDLSAGFFDSDLYLLSSNVPSKVPTTNLNPNYKHHNKHANIIHAHIYI